MPIGCRIKLFCCKSREVEEIHCVRDDELKKLKNKCHKLIIIVDRNIIYISLDSRQCDTQDDINLIIIDSYFLDKFTYPKTGGIYSKPVITVF